MYFAVIGNHPHIALKELALAGVFSWEKRAEHLFVFSCSAPERLAELASLIKWGKVLPLEEVENFLAGKRLLGTADSSLWINWKKKYGLKRFKQVALLHTDREVKKKGVEIIPLPQMRGFVGGVLGYQNIPLYELIDFGKPGRSMQMGMMPAKLTHTLINLARTQSSGESDSRPLIRDPFCGSGTSGFLANALWYDFVGSDLHLGLAQKNAERWKGTTIFRDQLFVFFSQDITQPLSTAQEQALLKQQELLIVTEGWLGPVIKQSTTLPEMLEYQRWVKNLFVQFLRKVAEFCTDHQRPLPVMCFTIPLYLSLREEEHTIQAALTQVTQELGRHVEALEGAYQRPGQQLARKILLLRAAS